MVSEEAYTDPYQRHGYENVIHVIHMGDTQTSGFDAQVKGYTNRTFRTLKVYHYWESTQRHKNVLSHSYVNS